MNEEVVKSLLDRALEENPSLFLIDFKVLPDNKICVEVDGDNGVSLEECIRISRKIEHNLDRDIEDFSLEVTSPDISKPIKNIRQYKKNLKRTLSVSLSNNKIVEGKLLDFSDTYIELEWKSREPKIVGKGKRTVINNRKIPYEDILETKVKLKF